MCSPVLHGLKRLSHKKNLSFPCQINVLKYVLSFLHANPEFWDPGKSTTRQPV